MALLPSVSTYNQLTPIAAFLLEVDGKHGRLKTNIDDRLHTFHLGGKRIEKFEENNTHGVDVDFLIVRFTMHLHKGHMPFEAVFPPA